MRNDFNRSNENREEREIECKPENCNIKVGRREKKRSCLKCGREFPSKGPYNRICVKCDLMNGKTGVVRYSLTLRFEEITEFLK
ncbi:MAG: hypothetical protein K8F52_12695 [Candidatus Scalindua rubra]|uniref:Uncharacterized protein n=1 Tax=Candidatus Scalindua brodae TaxID=237368 RepID=A0A0B0EGV1_9BACT|nr:MAG: hypothetical protein SCABRO_02443 [Candidatus Scalindua brodae]MBZ0109517.1 hypothetical protein [Candidatus Scalindua rubra]TWU34833.1 hypothetical protein S225a_11910 [Candidatus Brocadiaceae bacterium S225]